ncbi:hypothetical protein CHLNCDRAFT_138967 [Chlorella variabilis]|uniref:MYND-type domain-containing protein n=1 Tax=Chlorella variabilis TaxID=554065 RepID=E1ZP21_CHLVA|nr:hypothetical protein CHLNCDRAFT_138967 [Chlorella variabilis]EFN52439.1 hypothetical protein CHLNCDRAFT_138967 [Chlorella variabilis]|eukprot:XP_005844541.1 hypothetical protein CHLNCDRAFT_138967 [Chlorella variabilis]
MAALLQQLGGPGGLPLLCQLAGEVAAAAATAAQDSTAAGAAQSSSSFGAQCWACRAAEALLRLAPLLASQPAQETDSFGASWRSMGALVAAAGGADALLMSRSDGLDTEALCVALAMLLPKVVASLLFISDWEAAASPGNALASFHALLSACQLTHTMEPHLRPSSTAAAGSGGAAAGAPAAGSCAAAPDPSPAGGQAPIVFESTAVSLGCCLSQSTMHTYALSHTMMGRLPANEQGPYARRLECCLLLFLGTLSALPLPPGTVQSGVDRKRCVMLNVLLKAEEQALASLWRLLLGTASAAAAGMDTLSLLAEVACRGLRGLCAPGGGGANLDDWDAPLYMLNLVANVEPAVLPRLVKLRALMRMLCASGAALAEAASWQAPQGKTHYRCLLLLLRQLAPHLQVDPSKRGDVRLCVEGLASEDGQRRRQALPLFASLVGEQQEEQPAAGDGASPRRQPLGPEGEQLAVRRARALAVLKCANPRCSRLAGASEAAAPRGRLCSGCRTVRFCSEACSRQEWPQHRAACRLLRAASHNG